MSNGVFTTLRGSRALTRSSVTRILSNCLTGFSSHPCYSRSPIGRITFDRPRSETKFYSTQKNEAVKDVAPWTDFQAIETKTKESFIEMVEIYKERERLRRGHVEFIYSALKYMKEFGVEKDLEIYKALIDILPKGTMIPKNNFQVMMMHYPKQQQCAIDLLEQMELNGVIPDWNMEDQLVNVFGRKGHPVRRYWRMMYWMPKFKNASPWAIPDSLSSDPYQLALHAIERITSVDVSSKIDVFKTSDIEDALEDTWIVSGQSPDQQRLLRDLPNGTPVYVEGRYKVFIRKHAVTYFVLRADIKTQPPPKEDYDDITDMYFPLFSKPKAGLSIRPTVHEQDDGIILGVCCTGTSSRDSLLSWVRSLEKANPHLAELTVVFTLKAPQEEAGLINMPNDVDKGRTSDAQQKAQ